MVRARRIRTLSVCLLLTVAASAVAILALGTGEFTIPPLDVVRALIGQGPPADHLVVVEWRLPRVLLALLIGAALGLSGAIFQALTRNPLGSPDVIGFNTGAYTGVLLVAGSGYYVTALGALIGGLATAIAVYLLAWKRGVQGFRLIIVGIAVSAVLGSLNEWFVTRADLQTALAAAIWGQGTLNGLGWASVGPVVAGTLLGVAALLALGPRLSILEMGQDTAAALGVRVERTRLAYLAVGVALTAVATAAAGPISFVALAAPQLALRLTRTPGVALTPAAVMGAFLTIASDWLAQHLFAPTQLPVGVVTVALGGGYFVWLLYRQGRNA
ncbi:iron chelate uptake ABC transporter family permease subunit [Actinoplanes sp. NPDC051851]|uniref:FecCD family ABC transporter permease n=1 Tax=Actinoplanes sp. NPDC051851 TaxID=3154753 RepID=UPI0034402970